MKLGRPSRVVSMLLGIVLTLGMVSCGGNHAAREASPSEQVAALPVGELAGAIVLPDGVATPFSTLTVRNSLGSASVSASGQFTLTRFTDGPQMAFVVGPAGKFMLMGWLDSSRTRLSARSTAEVLLYTVTGCFTLPASARATAMDLIAASPEVVALTTAIESSLRENPDGMVGENGPVKQALSKAAASLAATSGVPTQQGVIVDPIAEKSGLRVNLPGVNTMVLRNRYRRASHAYIKQVSYVPEAGGAAVPAEKALTEFDVSPVLAINGLLGTIGDIAAGRMAYSEVDSSPVDLPLVAGSKKTTYQLMVVGPGLAPGDLSVLTPEQDQQRRRTSLLFLAKELFLPFVVNIALPNCFDGPNSGMLKGLGAGTVGADLLNQLAVLPGLMDQLEACDFQGALWTAANSFFNTVSFQQVVIGFVAQHIANLGDSAAIASNLQIAGVAFEVAGIANQVLVGLDVAGIISHNAASNKADAWTMEVTKPTLRLTPGESEIHALGNVFLTCEFAEAAGSGVPLVYHWSTTGRGGTLTDTALEPHSGTSFESSVGTVYYFADKGIAATDSVTVEVFRLDGSARTSLGIAQARVKVTTGHVTITPSALTIADDTKPTFSAAVSGSDGPFTYTWSTARDGLREGNGAWQRSIETTSNTIQFGRVSGGPGERTVRVVVNKTVDGRSFKVGEATASLKLETFSIPATPHSYYIARPLQPGEYGYPDQWLVGWNYGVKFNKVEDAVSYTVYLKNDFYYWGKDPVFSGPPNQYFRDLGDAFLCWQYGGGGQCPPPVPTEAESIAPYVGNYTGGTFYAIPTFGR